MKKIIIATGIIIIGALIFAVGVSGRFHKGFEYEHKSISSLINDDAVKINDEHIFTIDYFYDGIGQYEAFIDTIEDNSSDVFVVKACDTIDIKEHVRQEAVVEDVIKGEAHRGDSVSIIYQGYFNMSNNQQYVGLYNQNFMQPDKEYIVFANRYETMGNWYKIGDGPLQSYFCINNENAYGIYDGKGTYGDYARYEFFVDCDESGDNIIKIKEYLLNKYADEITK